MNDQSREIQLLSLARDGDVAGLLELAYDDPAGDPDEMAYKWLNVAADFGHDEAEDMVDAFHQGPLHADDDNLVSGHAHFELAVAYLTGRDGLPVDFGKARGHVKEMAVRHYPYTVQDGKGMLAEARRA